MSEHEDPSKWERVDRFAYRFDRIGKSAVVLGAGVAALIYCVQLPGIAPKVVGIGALIASLPLARLAWRGLGRFYELDKDE